MEVENAQLFGTALQAHLARVESVNVDVLDEVAGLLLDVVRMDGLIYTAGSGHSLVPVLETFYRAGGLACVHPLAHPGLLPLHGARASTELERVEGLAATLLTQLDVDEHDLGLVFSNSGVNPFPVELAQGLRAAGMPVVAVVSTAHMREAPQRASQKLGDVATHVIDTLAPPGDAAYPADGAATAGLSSLVSVFCWDLLLARLADRARTDGVRLPLWTSANIEGGEERNEELFNRYRTRVPGLA